MALLTMLYNGARLAALAYKPTHVAECLLWEAAHELLMLPCPPLPVESKQVHEVTEHVHSSGGGHAYVIDTAGPLVVVFTGSNDGEDWQTNARCRRTRAQGQYGPVKVHRGFHRAMMDIAVTGGLISLLTRLQAPQRPVWYVGHSQGAALAAMCAFFFMPCPAMVLLYGCPRLGGRVFAQRFNTHVPAYNIINGVDAVPSTPSVLRGYRHAGQRVHIDRQGTVHLPGGPGGLTRLRLADAWYYARRFRLVRQSAYDHAVTSYLLALNPKKP